MKNKLFLVASFLILFSAIFYPGQFNKKNIVEATGHLQYFGFWGGATPVDTSVTSYSNVAFINPLTESSRMAAAQAAGLKIIAIFPEPSQHTDLYLRQYFDHPAPEWVNFKSAITPYVSSGSIAAIALMDEPVGSSGYSWSSVTGDINYAVGKIKNVFPSVPVYVNFLPPGDPYWASAGVGPMGQLPTSLDWVGFDCYGHLSNCDGYGQSYQTAFDQFETKKQLSQKVVIIPQSFRDVSHPQYGWDISEQEISDNADALLQIANTHSDVIGFMPFMWGNAGIMTGLGSLSVTLQNHFVSIGTSIIGSAPLVPPTNLVLLCPSPGTTVTASWTPPSGYNTFYFRANQGVDNWTLPPAVQQDSVVGSSANFAATPGQTYHIWVHTRDSITSAASATVDANVTCQSAPTTPTLNTVTINSNTVKPDSLTPYTITITSLDSGGGNKITHNYTVLNFQGLNSGIYRGGLNWYYDQTYTGWDSYKNKRLCTGSGGIGAVNPQYGLGYINLVSCNSVISGLTHTTTFTVTFDQSFISPTLNNHISGFAQNSDGNFDGWKDFAGFDLINNVYSIPVSIVIVSLEGRNSKVVLGSVDVLDSSKNIVKSYNFTTDSAGAANITLDIAPITGYLKVKAPGFLARVLSVDLNNPVTYGFQRLLTGDISGDNRVNSVDFSAMNTKWFAGDPVADLNQDGIVNSLDFSLMSKNWQLVGEN